MPAVAITPDMLVSHAAAVIHEHASSRDRGLLLALLTYAPTEKGRVGVANKIIHGENMHSEDPTTDWGHLQQTADFYWRNIIIPVRVTGGKTPEPGSRMPQSGFRSVRAFDSPAEKQAVGELKDIMKAANLRDKCRCVISGKVDPETITNGLGSLAPGGTGFEVTRVTHILPFSLRESTGNTSALHLPTIWGALESFSGTSLSVLVHGGINGLDNVLTLSATVHRYFTELQIGLQPTAEGSHVYRVRTWGKVAPRLGLPKTVKLTSATGAPCPNPAFLALHCAICQVLWSSSRAEELKEILEDLAEVSLLAPDGSSANLINIAIYRSLALANGEM